MSILKQKLIFFNQAGQRVPRQLRKLFSFGCRSLSLQNIVSLRGNARLVETNFNTAKTKAYQLLANGRWLDVFPRLLGQLGLVSADSRVALDFSSFGNFQVLTFAVETRQGRALPIYFEIIVYPIKEDSQNLFIRQAIERFSAAVSCCPKLVMDRGFACPYIIEYLAEASHPFLVRIKSVKTLTAREKQLIFKARQAPDNDLEVRAYEHDLRLVVSADPNNGNEPWYLITNDFASLRPAVIRDYYYRFEIEEFFKDAKWLQGLEHLKVRKIQSMSVVLWFVILGWWCLALLDRDTPLLQGRHPHDQISLPRLVLEALGREERALAVEHLVVCMGGRKEVVLLEKV